MRSALRTGLVPQIESTKAVGLVFLPGAMTGLVLAGVDAGDAVAIQLAIMYLILGSVATSITVIGLGLDPEALHPRSPAAPTGAGGRMNGGGATGRVVVVGSLNVDLVARVERLPRSGETVTGSDLERTPGGKGLNQAVAAARAGVSVVMVGSVGEDEHGRWLREVAAAEGIDVGPVAAVVAATGTALITVGGEGANTIVVSPGANGETGGEVPAALEALALGPGDVVLGQAEIPVEAVVAASRAGRAAGATTIVNQAPFRPLGDELWSLVDVLVVNETELAELLAAADGGELVVDEDGPVEAAHASAVAAAGGLLASRPGPGALVVTLGRAGAVVVSADGSAASVPGRTVVAVDTVGAGDCLAGWLAAGVAEGLAVGPALERAVLASSLAVQRTGAATAMPHRIEVEQAG